MAGGPTITVRQIASYPVAPVIPSDLVLRQSGGLGGPYATSTAYELVAQALASGGPLGVGYAAPANAGGNQIFSAAYTLPFEGGLIWNAYDLMSGAGPLYWGNGAAAGFLFDQVNGFYWNLSPPGQAGALLAGTEALMGLSMAGNLRLPFGQITVARDPSSAFEVATMGWVGANTVASFNGRRGVVTLSAADVYGAIGLDPCDPFVTTSQMGAAICAGVAQGLAMTSIVSTFNGRLGNVFLNTCDLNIATFTGPPGGLPALMVPTPPALSATPPPDPTSVINIAWLEDYISNTAGLATETWVNQQIANAIAGTVTSFNGRQGIVALTLADITGAGGAPVASPNFSGIPTAPTANTGTSTAQLATTAFVMNTLTAISPGVITFNTRSGAVTLDAADINNAGGALLASPNFTGVPAAPTAPTGTSTSQIATTAFVMNELTAISAGVVSFNGRSGVVTLQLADIQAAGGAPAASPILTGVPTAPTAANGTNSQQLATTAFVMNEIAAINAGVLTFNGRSGAVTLTANDITAVGGLTNPSPALTGTPTSPTPAPTDSSTNIATTAFVHNAVAAAAGATVSPTAPPTPNTGSLWFNTTPSPPLLNVWNGTAWLPTTNTSALAPLANPALTGTPTAPTAAPGTSSTQLATTAFVQAAVAASVTSFNGRTGAVTLTSLDITGAGGATAAQLAGYLPLSGGTMTTPGNITTPGGMTAVSYSLSGASPTSFNRDGSGNPMVNWTTGWYDTFNLANGTRQMIGGNQVLWSLNAAGGVTLLGGITAPGGVNGSALSMTGSANNQINGPLALASTLNVSGTLQGNAINGTNGQFTGNLGCNGTLGNIGPAGSAFALQNTGTWCQMVYTAGWAFQWTIANGVWVWLGGNSQLATLDSAGNMHLAGSLSQGSDETTKENVASFAQGVSLASQLQPKSFQRLPGTLPDGSAAAAQPVQWGFIAQDVASVVPAAVQGASGSMTLDITALVAVLANAVKQLISRVAALESAAGVTPTAAETA